MEKQESVSIFRGLSNTQKSKTFTKILHNLHHTSSLFVELFVMPYSEDFLTLIYITLWCTAEGLNFHFFFDGHVTNFTVPLGVTKNRHMVCLKF